MAKKNSNGGGMASAAAALHHVAYLNNARRINKAAAAMKHHISVAIGVAAYVKRAGARSCIIYQATNRARRSISS